MLNDIRTRLKQKLCNREYVDSIIAKELADAALRSAKEQRPAQEGDDDYFKWHDGRSLDIQSLVLDVLFELMKRDRSITSLSLELANGKTYKLHWQ